MAQQLKAKYFNVQPGHMLCRQCITVYENIIDTSPSNTKVEETPMDDIDEDTLDDTTYEVYETPRKHLNTRLEMVGESSVNLHGVPQQSRATSTKQKLDKVVDTYKITITEAYKYVRMYWTHLTLFLRKVMHSGKQQSQNGCMML